MHLIDTAIKPVKHGVYPTLNNLNEVMSLAKSKLPITDPNELVSLMFTWQNTLLKEIEESSK